MPGSQLPHITGIFVPKGESFLFTLLDLYQGAGGTNFYLVAIGLTTLITTILVKKFFPKLPNLLLGMVVGSLLALYFKEFTTDRG
jgi:SulP family sulfate permease